MPLPIPPTPPTDPVEWGPLSNWIGPWIGAVVAIVIAIYGRFEKRDERTLDELRDDIKEVKGDIGAVKDNVGELYQQDKALDTRLATVETKIAYLPTKEDLHQIALGQATHGEMLRGFGHVLENLAGSVKAIERALLERDMREDRK